MKKLMLACAAALFALCTASAKDITIDAAGAKKAYAAQKIMIEPMDKTVTVKGKIITIAPKKEGVTYTISGYFDGQIINKTKNTVLKLKGAYLENTSGAPAIYGEAKTEVSTTKDTTNYVVSDGKSADKTGAIHSKKGLVLGGSGTLYAVGNVYHGVKGDSVKIKGSGTLYAQGTKKGAAVNCDSLTVEKDKTFRAYLVNSKNAVKADTTITISSGEFFLYGNETAFKTDTKKDAPKEPHGITLSGGSVYVSKGTVLQETESGAYKVTGTKIVEE
ncbi:MAG: carbohydrate-binding domain-containing protein [Treponema sp.]|nr:carbohydrate-binding domain-containing protein [Treponema sp.]